MSALDTLHTIRSATGTAHTKGLGDETIRRFVALDPDLGTAIDRAREAFQAMRREHADVLAMDEADAVTHVQRGFVNFYAADAVNPFVALAAQGAWLVTLHGAVVHDSGGYGMLGFGHEPAPVAAAIARPQVMANIMTPNLVQERFVAALRREVGHARGTGCPFDRFLCMNSGSEAMSVAARISDVNARRMTDAGGRHAGRRCVYLAVERAFHGRTFRPASFSGSTRPKYEEHLASFRALDNLWRVPSNDVAALRDAFTRADAEGVFIESMYVEPVQGEGSPGAAMSREFYDEARRLTLEHGSLLVMDSIQAGLRAHGTLSMVDYPGFEDCVPPDMESWSKALNAGQYPLSVLGLTERAASQYVVGVYGNTMTTNPRALEVACAVLSMVTPELRRNVREQGARFLDDLRALQAEFPELIAEVKGTGLLFCAELNAEHVAAIGSGSAEERCRLRGVGIIHGGRNALRFTPHFRITDAERELMVATLREVLAEVRAEITVAP